MVRHKKTPPERGFLKAGLNQSRSLNVGCLLALWTLRDFELNFLTFFERLEAVHLDCGKVCEQIFAAVVRSNEAEALRVVKPFNGTCCHN